MRVKTGFTRKAHHNKIHKLSKGYRMSKHKLVKVAKEAILHAGMYAFNGRRKKKGDFREIWIQRIHAALSESGTTYSSFIHSLTKENISLNRKMLSELALHEPDSFQAVLQEVTKG